MNYTIPLMVFQTSNGWDSCPQAYLPLTAVRLTKAVVQRGFHVAGAPDNSWTMQWRSRSRLASRLCKRR